MERVFRGSVLRSVMVAGFSLCMVAAVAACGSSADSDGGSQAATTNLRFSLDYKIDGLHAPLYLAQSNGYYSADHLNVTIDPSGGTADAISRVAAGKADMAVVDAAGMISAIAQSNAPLIAVAAYQQSIGSSTVSLKKENILKPSDLKGKRIGDNAAAANDIENAFLTINGMTRSDITVTKATASTMITGLLAGKFDAVNLQPQVAQSIIDQVNIMHWSDFGIDVYGHVLIANTDYLAKNPDAVKAFVHDTAKGLKETLDNPQKAAEVTAKAARSDDVSFFKGELDIIKPFFTGGPDLQTDGIGTMTDTRWNATQDLSVKYMGQKTPLPLNKIYTAAYLGEIVK